MGGTVTLLSFELTSEGASLSTEPSLLLLLIAVSRTRQVIVRWLARTAVGYTSSLCSEVSYPEDFLFIRRTGGRNNVLFRHLAVQQALVILRLIWREWHHPHLSFPSPHLLW
jgi:hypothetical protein